MAATVSLRDLLLGGPGLSAYAYQAELYCVQCGQDITHDLHERSALPSTLDECSDTERCPCPIFFGESPDCAQHCAECGEYLYGEESDPEEDGPIGYLENGWQNLGTFQRAYADGILFTEREGDTDTPLDRNHGLNDFAPEAVLKIMEDCEAFRARVYAHDRAALCAVAGLDASAPDYALSDRLRDLDAPEVYPLTEAITADPDMAGYHFWVTRIRCGSSFADGRWGDQGDALAEVAREFGEVNVYLGDNGLIYLSPC